MSSGLRRKASVPVADMQLQNSFSSTDVNAGLELCPIKHLSMGKKAGGNG